ncbi:MAG: GNAT family N-acetyltransferase [Eubacteriales bacterium]|nr:GNAT family N-acetyltransferase [Eubacteriales bacterium]
MIYQVKGTKEIKEIFADWQETMVWSCIQGVMGHLYADSLVHPRSAMAILGDFCFFAGIPNLELVSYKPEWCNQDFIIMTALSSDWFSFIKAVYGKEAKKVSRFAFKKEPDLFDREKLSAFAETIKDEFTLRRIDREIYDYCRMQDWSRDFVSSYTDYDEYKKIGLGVVALRDGTPVSGASSYSSYQGGIEIEIDTKEEYRRQGLATACGARLILECLERGLYPSWDAQNRWSVALAEKLGYCFEHEYTAYEIKGY